MLEMFLKESENDSIVEDLYIAKDVSNAKYSIEEKKKYLEEAIRNGGYYGDNGCWNSIMTFPNDKNVYRGRVETLIIKDDKYIFLKFLPRDSQNYKRTYTVPGGSFELNIPNDIQAINECMEEARIKISNIQASGITYKELKDPPKWAIEKQPVNWNGNYTEVYVGEYDGKYTGHIDKVDEDKFMITGKFYKLDEIFKYLKKEHKEALKVIYPNRFNSGKFVKESVNERNNVSVKQIKGVIKKIRAKVDKDKKPPTGNQNCMLCTWCAEAWFRGYDILPRPIYSPTDKVFDFEGYEIIKSPTKISIKDKNEIKKIISVAGDGSRFYTHMKWKNGNGGHEFILININNDIYVLDAQQGLLENVESSEGSTYFKEVDYSKSYIIRMDNKEFNKPMFKYNNDLYIKDFTEEDKKYVNNYMIESEDKSELIKGFKSKTSNVQYKTLSIDKPEIYDYLKNHFSKNNPMWEGVKDSKTYMDCFINGNNSRHIKRVGEIFINKANDEVIGFEVVEKPNNYLAIEIPDKKYHGYGFGKILLEDAIKKHGCKKLYVAVDNKIAIKMYTNRGFEKPGEFYDGEYWRMELKESNYTESTSENLFHVSSVKLAHTTLEPRIPDNFLVRNGYEDNTTERISVCKSIDDCLTAMSRNLKNKDFYVYKLKDINVKKKIPSIKEVPDVSITNEVWLLEPSEFELVGKIHVTGTKGDGLSYTYGDNTAELYRWKWSYVK